MPAFNKLLENVLNKKSLVFVCMDSQWIAMMVASATPTAILSAVPILEAKGLRMDMEIAV